MKKSIIGATAALCILSAGLVSAAGQSQPDQSIAVPAPARSTYTLGANEFTEYAYAYQLSNGQVARFSQQGNHYYVVLKGSLDMLKRDESFGHAGTPTRLRPIGPGLFVTDKGTQMRFADQGDQVTISNFERLPAAKVASASRDVQMIARR